jgi:hypothetical protein
MRRTIVSLLVAVGVFAGSSARAQELVATMDLSGWILAAGVGFTKLEGEVTFDGERFPVTVFGTSALAAGASHLRGSAQIYGLARVADLNSRFDGGLLGGTFGAGGHGGRWVNDDGVAIEAQFHTCGLDLAGGFERIRVVVHERDGMPTGRWFWPGESALH